MHPIDPPVVSRMQYPGCKQFHMNPPDGVPEDECGTMNVLAGTIEGGVFDGGPVFRTFWKLEDDELEILNNGGYVQLFFYSSQLPPHGMIIQEEEDARQNFE
jgi:hypothetical protein